MSYECSAAQFPTTAITLRSYFHIIFSISFFTEEEQLVECLFNISRGVGQAYGVIERSHSLLLCSVLMRWTSGISILMSDLLTFSTVFRRLQSFRLCRVFHQLCRQDLMELHLDHISFIFLRACKQKKTVNNTNIGIFLHEFLVSITISTSAPAAQNAFKILSIWQEWDKCIQENSGEDQSTDLNIPTCFQFFKFSV